MRTGKTGAPPSSARRWRAPATPTFPPAPAFPLSAGAAPCVNAPRTAPLAGSAKMIKSLTLAIDVYRPSLNSDPVLVVVAVAGADYRVYQLGEGWLDEPVGLRLVARDEVIEDWGETPDAIEPDHSITFRSEEHTSELQSLMRISYAVFFLKKKKQDI